MLAALSAQLSGLTRAISTLTGSVREIQAQQEALVRRLDAVEAAQAASVPEALGPAPASMLSAQGQIDGTGSDSVASTSSKPPSTKKARKVKSGGTSSKAIDLADGAEELNMEVTTPVVV
jgi:hypothetical protein